MCFEYVLKICEKNFENKLTTLSVCKDIIKRWVRYVDDILILWEGSLSELEVLMKEINNTDQ